MKTTIRTRAAAFAGAILVTLASVTLIADYARPEAAAIRLASAAH